MIYFFFFLPHVCLCASVEIIRERNIINKKKKKTGHEGSKAAKNEALYTVKRGKKAEGRSNA